MTTYVYTGGNFDGYMQGLPATDLDTADLTAAQLVILGQAITAGLYEEGELTYTIRPTGFDS